MLILISDAFDNSMPDTLTKFGEVTDDKSRIAEAEVVLIRSKTKVTKEYIDSAQNLKLVIRGGVGLDNVDREYASKRGIAVHNTSAASAIAVAECAFTLMIGITNHIGRADSSMRNGKWIKKELKRTELYRKTLGIIGLGVIGKTVVKLVKGFNFNIMAFDLFQDEQFAKKYAMDKNII